MSKIKPIEQQDYPLNVIGDLGMRLPTPNSKRMCRYITVECPVCLSNFDTIAGDVKRGKSSKCISCSAKVRRITHGDTNSRLHNAWTNIKSRCLDKNNPAYKNYGDRGIAVCPAWKESYIDFKLWAESNGYGEKLTIDRKNNNIGYNPDNCRWVDMNIQAQNKRLLISSNSSGFRGVVRRKGGKYQASIQVSKSRVCIGSFDSDVDAANAYDEYVLNNNLEHPINAAERELEMMKEDKENA